ncbi:MAG: XdhC family protein [Defluviitaleaceae bacterium]|nr:XdhC family protein [Defluviitaleaceae bacterium]
MIQNILDFAAKKTGAGERVAIVTVTATSGSSPASPGQVMAVAADESTAGTVGGGASEYRLIKQAAQAITDGAKIFEFAFDHAEEGMTCGGSLQGFVNILGSQAGIAIFGGGHIAQCLAKIAVLTGFGVSIIEDRPEFSPYFENTRYLVCEPDEYESATVLSGCDYAVVCTRGHRTDADALRYCLTKPLKYLGMIGSSKKSATVLETMRKEGTAPDALSRVFTPIGLNIATEAPAEIAVSILAEILLVKNGGTPAHKRD